MRLIWRPEALENLDQVLAYIRERNPAAADRLLIDVEACAERLPDHPYLYRSGRVAGTREAVVHPNYILVYRVGSDTIDIVGFIHARRRYP